jgi:transposase
VRATTVLNRVLALPGGRVTGVTVTDGGDVIADVQLRGRRLLCPCGAWSSAAYDTSVRRWRHLDVAGARLYLRGPVRRVECASCGRTRTEQVPWARPGARHTLAFEDMVAWLTQRCDKTTVSTLMRCAWATISSIAERVVADHLSDDRLDGLRRIGVDEISYRFGHRYLTIVVDHDSGRVVWVNEGRSVASLTAFYDALGPERCALLEAVSMDMGPAYRGATERAAPQAVICLDPFHVMQWAGRAMDKAFNAATAGRDKLALSGKQWSRTRVLLRSGGDKITDAQRQQIRVFRRSRYQLFRAWELKEDLRDLYRCVRPEDAYDYLEAWIATARDSQIPSMVDLANRLERHHAGIAAAVELGLSNSRVEGLNGRIRLIHRRGYGYHTAAALSALIYLCCSGLPIQLPTRT